MFRTIRLALIGSLFLPNATLLANTTFNGYLASDDGVAFFAYSAAADTTVTVRTITFAAGGFSPILSLYDSTGGFLFSNNGEANNDCLTHGTDAATGYCWDTDIIWPATGGVVYYVALSQNSNFATGNSLPISQAFTSWNNVDTFTQFSFTNFTADPLFGPGCGQPGFCTFDGYPRGGNFTLDLLAPEGGPAVAAQRVVPEPATAYLWASAGGLLAGLCRSRRNRRVSQN